MSLNTLHHEEILIKILKAIFEDSHIAPYLAFKGGTAAMFFYKLDRFSVDLDFDLLDEGKAESVNNGLFEVLRRYGTIKNHDIKRFSFVFIVSYEGKKKDEQNLKVEVNKRLFDSRYELKDFMGIAMKVMVQQDMAAHKLVAMYERIGKANRDIYDTWFILQHAWPININIITHRTKLTFDQFLQASIKALEQLDNRTILQGLGELLSEKQKNWVRTKLKSETLFLLSLKARVTQKSTR